MNVGLVVVIILKTLGKNLWTVSNVHNNNIIAVLRLVNSGQYSIPVMHNCFHC